MNEVSIVNVLFSSFELPAEMNRKQKCYCKIKKCVNEIGTLDRNVLFFGKILVNNMFHMTIVVDKTKIVCKNFDILE